ncbi:MAG: prepilin-type N-terminal cleavage/methylation domain-containing protein [Candidatus Saccharibacteria bacterium]
MIKSIKNKGFTIVELLVVIVVIGILAAITIVSFTGVTGKANTQKNLSNASSAIQVLDSIFAETNVYPITTVLLNSGGTYAKMPSGVTVTNMQPAATSDITKAYLQYSTCAGGGAKISYWDWSDGLKSVYTGGATSSSSCTVVLL